MTENEFWILVARNRPEQTQEELVRKLKLSITPLSDEDLKAFDKLYGQKMRLLYRWDIWGCAYIVGGCDSEYDFAEFRNFVISLGQEWFERVIADPDALGELDSWPLKDGNAYPYIEDYDLVAGQIYEDRTSLELPFVPSGKATPAGKKFKTKSKGLKKTYPKMSARFPF